VWYDKTASACSPEKETKVNPQQGTRRQWKGKVEARVGEDGLDDSPISAVLTGYESAVLDCLRRSQTGLTARQLQAQVACEAEVLEQALKSLIERDLVARLNTIIPSYTYRPRDASVHAE